MRSSALLHFLNMSDSDPVPTAEEATQMKQHIEVLQGQLMLLNAMVTSLDAEYKKFLAAHPESVGSSARERRFMRGSVE